MLSEGGELKLLYWQPSQEMLDYEVLIADTGRYCRHAGQNRYHQRYADDDGGSVWLAVAGNDAAGRNTDENGWLKGHIRCLITGGVAAGADPSLLLQAVVMWLEYLNDWSVFWMGTVGYPLADI